MDDLHEKHGLELISHYFCYGATEDELKQLSRKQIATLSAAGLMK